MNAPPGFQFQERDKNWCPLRRIKGVSVRNSDAPRDEGDLGSPRAAPAASGEASGTIYGFIHQLLLATSLSLGIPAPPRAAHKPLAHRDVPGCHAAGSTSRSSPGQANCFSISRCCCCLVCDAKRPRCFHCRVDKPRELLSQHATAKTSVWPRVQEPRS